MEGHVTTYLGHVAVLQAGLAHCVKNHVLRERMGLPAATSVSARMVATVIQ